MFLYFIILAELPATIAPFGTFLVTTAEAPIIAPSPIVTPGNSVTSPPIHTFSSTITFFAKVISPYGIALSLL